MESEYASNEFPRSPATIEYVVIERRGGIVVSQAVDDPSDTMKDSVFSLSMSLKVDGESLVGRHFRVDVAPQVRGRVLTNYRLVSERENETD
jgi:hypothetical protein